MTETNFQPHPHWKGGIGGGWGDSKCDYCDYAADMVLTGFHACFEHRTRLLKERGHLAEEAYIRKLKELESKTEGNAIEKREMDAD